MKFKMLFIFGFLHCTSTALAFYDLNYGQWRGSGTWTTSKETIQLSTNMQIMAVPENERGKQLQFAYIIPGRATVYIEDYWVYFRNETKFDIYTQEDYTVPSYNWLDIYFSPTGSGKCHFLTGGGTFCAVKYEVDEIITEDFITFHTDGSITRRGRRTLANGDNESWNLILHPKKKTK